MLGYYACIFQAGYGVILLFLEGSLLLDQSGDALTWALIIIVAVIILGGLIASVVKKFGRFKRKLSYINMEIGRTTGGERKKWKKRKRRLWLSLLPFYKGHN